MKWFLFTLAIGLAASDKLDRTYLPPPGAQHAGGNLGDHDAPLAPPTHSGPRLNVGGQEGSQTNFGLNGETLNFGDKIPKVPTTTISYAFSQTTTYPPGEGYETTALPINSVTGLPIQLDQVNIPYGSPQGQQNIQNLPSYTQNQGQGTPTSGTNLLPGFGTQSPTSVPATFGITGYDQSFKQPNQYTGQNVITPSGTDQIPGSVYQLPGQNQDQTQYPSQGSTGQKGLLPTVAPGSQGIEKYPGQYVVTPGGVIQIPGGNQGLTQYPGGQITGQGFVPSTVSPTNLQPGSNQYGVNYDGSQGPVPQGTYTGQPINVQDQSKPQLNQASYQIQEPFNSGNIPSQYPARNQIASEPSGSGNAYQPGSTTPSTIPSSYYNGIPSTTPSFDFPSSTSAYSTVGPVYRPERPQAESDRNAVILNYENVHTPNGYSYSFDTSNGIHADESGIVDNGTKALGAYSYMGDDGKVYSVIYTADENGFQPRGDHLPTPPPIPEAIQRVIEQAARDKAAGIFDDGSYDEAKYGDKKYKIKANHRRPQLNRGKDNQIKPIVGIVDAEYDEDISQDQLSNMPPGTGTTPSAKLPSKPSKQINGGNNVQHTPEANRRISGEGITPFGHVDGIIMPIVEDGSNRYITKDQGSSRQRPMSSVSNLPFPGTEENNKYGSKFRGPSGRRPSMDMGKDMKTKYPGSQIDDARTEDYPGSQNDGFYTSSDQDRSSSPSAFDRSRENVSNNVDNVTGAPAGNRKQTSRQRVKDNRGPGATSNIYSPNNKETPQDGIFSQERTEMPSTSDYINNAANQPTSIQATQQKDNGYYYQPPNTKFEQNKFPSRFSPQEVTSTMTPNQSRTEFEQGTTRKPFITPNVYNENDGSRQSTTRRPFTTIGVTSPTDTSYTDYEDGDDYEIDQDSNDKTNSSGRPDGKPGTTSRPYQSMQTSSRPQYVTQKGTPGNRIEKPGTFTPRYTYGSTTPMPSHSSRFGNTESPRKTKPQQGRPSSPISTIAVGQPIISLIPSGTRPSDYNYQTTRPTSNYSVSNLVSSYPTTGVVPGFDSFSSTTGVSPSQSYSTSTYGPTNFSGITTVPPTSGYSHDLGPQNPSRTPGGLQSPTGTIHSGYHYDPPKSYYSTTTVSPNPGMSGTAPTSPPGTYQTTYHQGPGGFQSTSTSAPGRPGTFIESQPGFTAPESSPFGSYEGNLQNGPSQPEFSTTIVSSIPGNSPAFGFSGDNGATKHQPIYSYEFGSSRPTFSTEASSTVSTTPGTSGTVPSQGYPTTYVPGFQTTKDTFATGPSLVDGFGRPITTEQGLNSEFSYQGQDSPRPGDNVGSNFVGTEQSTSYPEPYDQSKVIGEDFSGPKQPQRYDPKTGYHYK